MPASVEDRIVNDEEPTPESGNDAALATFDHALVGLRATGASVDTRALVELIAKHGADEGELLSEYEEVAATSSDPGTRYLIDLILEDERRHHRLLAEVANAMAWGSIDGSSERATPSVPRNLDGELLAQTRRLLEAEEIDYRALRRIRRRLQPFAETTLWALIIDLMLLDTKKHATVLRFLERHQRRNG